MHSVETGPAQMSIETAGVPYGTVEFIDCCCLQYIKIDKCDGTSVRRKNFSGSSVW